MSWKRLLDDRRVEPHTTSRAEIDGLRAAVERNLRDAAVRTISADNRFGIAYDAALLAVKMVVACAGYRVTGRGAHRTLFEALQLAMGPSQSRTAGYLDRCRRKRNDLSYDAADVVSETEADELLRLAEELFLQAEAWISRNHPLWERRTQ
jgi:hypothetical protein